MRGLFLVVTEEGKYLLVHIIVPENTHKKTSHATNIKLFVNSLILAHFPKPKLSVTLNRIQYKNFVSRFQASSILPHLASFQYVRCSVICDGFASNFSIEP